MLTGDLRLSEGLLRRWRRVTAPALPLLAILLWFGRHDGVVGNLAGGFFVVAATVLLSTVFERLVAQRSTTVPLLVTLETVAVAVVAVNGLFDWFGQSLRIMPANPGVLPTSPAASSISWCSRSSCSRIGSSPCNHEM